MKKIPLFASLAITISVCSFFACQKKVSESANVARASSESSISAAQLAKDPDFINLYLKSAKLMSNAQSISSAPELANDTLSYAECATFYSKLGFTDSAHLVACIKSINASAIALSNKGYGLTQNLVMNAINAYHQQTGTELYASPCTDQAIGSFTMNVTQCAALGLIPIAGEVLAGTCMVGALISYNGAMSACQA